jgi:hypothetical protein
MRARIVTIALVFLYILLTRGLVEALSGVADAFAQRPDVPGQVPVLISLLVLLLFGGLYWLIYKIAKGRNWARIIWLVLFVLEICYWFPRRAKFGASTVIGLCLDVVVAFMLFSRDARPWFNRQLAQHASTDA